MVNSMDEESFSLCIIYMLEICYLATFFLYNLKHIICNNLDVNNLRDKHFYIFIYQDIFDILY